MRKRGMGIASGILLLMACGGRSRDETQLLLLAADRAEAAETGVGAEQPAAVGPESPPAAAAASAADAGETASPVPSRAEPSVTDRLCQPGAGRCYGPFAEQCSPEGIWELKDQCGECNGRSSCEVQGPMAVCLPHICCFPQTRCNGQFLQICNAEATDFEPLQDCGSPELCDSIRGACLGTCVPGRTRCNGTELQRCSNDGGAFERLAYCATPALCEIGQQFGSCATGCALGETRCSGSTLMRCNEGRTGYETIEVCSAACDPPLGCVNADAGVADVAARDAAARDAAAP